MMKSLAVVTLACLIASLNSGCDKKARNQGAGGDNPSTDPKTDQSNPKSATKSNHGSTAEEAWLTDFDKAMKKAKKENKLLLVDFSGSDWCGWCIKMDEEVFAKQKFLNFAKKHFVLVLLDFPKKKKQPEKVKQQNQRLMRKYNVRGFPTILVMNADGKELDRTNYQAGGPDNFIKYLKQFVKK